MNEKNLRGVALAANGPVKIPTDFQSSGGGGDSNVLVLTTSDLFCVDSGATEENIKLNAADQAIVKSLYNGGYKNVQLCWIGQIFSGTEDSIIDITEIYNYANCLDGSLQTAIDNGYSPSFVVLSGSGNNMVTVSITIKYDSSNGDLYASIARIVPNVGTRTVRFTQATIGDTKNAVWFTSYLFQQTNKFIGYDIILNIVTSPVSYAILFSGMAYLSDNISFILSPCTASNGHASCVAKLEFNYDARLCSIAVMDNNVLVDKIVSVSVIRANFKLIDTI